MWHTMEVLKQRILKDGRAAGAGILKVDSFLNHQIDVELMEQIGEEFHRHFKGEKITKILTIESSGIAIAAFVAKAFKVPLLFAKKTMSKNMDGEILTAPVLSYTKGLTYLINVSKKFLGPEDNVLLIDDFLANGKASQALISIIKQAGATVAGLGIVIEKSFQGGRAELDAQGYRVESLARVKSLADGKVTFIE